MTVETKPHEATEEIRLPIEGMTCASCVRRVEKALGKVEGVAEASVNLATEKAQVRFDPAVAGLDKLRAAVEKAGYRIGAMEAEAPSADAAPGSTASAAPVDEHELAREREIDDLKRKWAVSLPVGLGMMALMYVPLPIDAMDVLMPALLIVATKTLSVPDISCEHCERAIKGALEPIGGVQSVDVDIPGKKVRVAYDEGKVTIARIKAAVEEEEYPVAAVE